MNNVVGGTVMNNVGGAAMENGGSLRKRVQLKG